jgi:putative nucleotidyltransferase with HDIG domain
MGTSLEISPASHRNRGASRSCQGAIRSAGADGAMRLERYLPLAIVVTAVVVAVPVALAEVIVEARNPLSMLAATTLAMAVSVALTSAGAAMWKRWPGSRDLLFADLMVWGWTRRYWTERRLGRARTLYESAKRAGPSVSIELIERLSAALEARDASTLGHSQRVARHAGRIARTMRLSAAQSAKVRTAAAVHDVGKLYTPQAILNNPGILDEQEYRVLKRHPVDGADMLERVGDPDIAAMVRYHHERLDGSGYPAGLVGEEIPLGARIIAVADTFDAISSDRVYRSARTHKRALDILSNEAGSRLDAAVVAAFARSYGARRPVAGLAFASAASQRALAWAQASSSTIGLGVARVAPLVPAVGAAGLLALAGGSHEGALAVRLRSPQTRAPQRDTLTAFAIAPTRGHEATSTLGARRIVLRPAPASRHRSRTAPTPMNTRASLTPTAPGAAVAQERAAGGEARAPEGPPGADPFTGSPPASPPSAQAVAPAGATPLPVIPASTPTVTGPSRAVSVATPAGTVSVTIPVVGVPAVKPPL